MLGIVARKMYERQGRTRKPRQGNCRAGKEIFEITTQQQLRHPVCHIACATSMPCCMDSATITMLVSMPRPISPRFIEHAWLEVCYCWTWFGFQTGHLTCPIWDQVLLYLPAPCSDAQKLWVSANLRVADNLECCTAVNWVQKGNAWLTRWTIPSSVVTQQDGKCDAENQVNHCIMHMQIQLHVEGPRLAYILSAENVD